MSENKNLLPCPFCGGEVTIAEKGSYKERWYFVTRGIKGNSCKCRLFMESEKFYDDGPQIAKDDTKKIVNRGMEQAYLQL